MFREADENEWLQWVLNKVVKPLNKQEETMAKTKDKLDRQDSDKKKKVEKSSGIQPFLFTPEEWPKDAPEQIIETTEGRNRLKSKKKVLSGNEAPEQLMMYLKNYEDKIYKNVVLTAPEKFAILKRLLTKKLKQS